MKILLFFLIFITGFILVILNNPNIVEKIYYMLEKLENKLNEIIEENEDDK